MGSGPGNPDDGGMENDDNDPQLPDESDELSEESDRADNGDASETHDTDPVEGIDEPDQAEIPADDMDTAHHWSDQTDVTDETDQADPTDMTDDFAGAFGADRPPPGSTGGPAAEGPPPVPPQGIPSPPAGGLVRDPYATFGGVASGIAHRYGFDVALTRIAFVVLIFLSGGTAFFVYLLAWLIIPRANVWPPTNMRPSRGPVTGRELGFGLLAAGVLIYLAVGTGSAGSVLVPVGLVAGGLWLLLQSPREESVSAAVPAGAGVSAPTPPMAPTAPGSPAAAFAPTVPSGSAPQASWPSAGAGAPVPPRSRGRKWFLRGVIGFAVLFALALIAIPVALIVAVSDGNINISSDRKISYMPDTVAEIPATIDADAAEVTLDLSLLDLEDFASVDPVDIGIDLGAGEISVILPADVPVVVDAEVGVGEILLLDRRSSGFVSDAVLSEPDPEIDMRIDLGAGEIRVTRAD